MTEETRQDTTAPEPDGPRSADQILQDPLVAAALADVGDAIVETREGVGEITLTVKRDRIRDVCRAFKADGFTYLVDLSGIDYSTYPGHSSDRFAVAYHLYSFEKNSRVRLKVFTPDGEAIPSVTPVWKTANWHEREVFDMFGVEFSDHPNLERILMWEDFNGYPLRKDFPVRGIDTGARIYPEVFPEGGGPQEGSTGKDVNDVNIYKGEWNQYGTAPLSQPAEPPKQLEKHVPEEAAAPPPAEADVPWHDENLSLPARMELAKSGSLKDKLFAAMAQTDCTACGWDCEGYAAAIAVGETNDLTLCVPGEDETEEMLNKLMQEAGKA